MRKKLCHPEKNGDPAEEREVPLSLPTTKYSVVPDSKCLDSGLRVPNLGPIGIIQSRWNIESKLN